MKRATVMLALAGCFIKPSHEASSDDAGARGSAVDARLPDADTTLPVNTMFVMNWTISGASGAQVISNANAACITEAQTAGLIGTYKAWLSVDGHEAPSSFSSAFGWQRVDGLPFADTLANAGPIYNPGLLDASGSAHEVRVTTATYGTFQTQPAPCINFTANTVDTVVAGWSLATTVDWTDGISDAPRTAERANCVASIWMYCFQTDHANLPPRPVVANARRVWVSAATFIPGSGLAAADGLCTSETPDGALALLPTSNASALSRLVMDARSFVRPDRTLVARDHFPAMISPINQNVAGGYVTSRVWAGAESLSLAGTAASTCSNWSSAGSTGLVMPSNYLRATTPLSNTQNCSVASSVICVEN